MTKLFILTLMLIGALYVISRDRKIEFEIEPREPERQF